jgi:hypothetical protein
MKLKNYILILLLFSLPFFAQETGTIPSMSIPKGNTPKPGSPNTSSTPQFSISKPFEPTIFRTPNKVYDAPKPLENNNKFNSKVSDLNVSKIYEKGLNNKSEGNGDYKFFKKNQLFGDFRTKSARITINCRDFGAIDGDLIRIWLDDVIIFNSYELDAEYSEFTISLKEGINKLEIEAVNDGVLFPNTGGFILKEKDGKVLTSNSWHVAAGYRAVFIIVKE